MMEETAAKDPVFARVYEAFKAFGAEAAAYHEISERAYYDTRELNQLKQD